MGIAERTNQKCTVMKFVIAIYDEKGHLVKTLSRADRAPGKHLLEWDGTSDQGGRVPAGVYYFQMEMEGRGTLARFKIILR